MYTWHPESWSQQARRLSNMAIEMFECAANKTQTIESLQYYNHLWSHSYRPSIITCRAAKRWGKYLKKYFKKHPEMKQYNKFLEHLD